MGSRRLLRQHPSSAEPWPSFHLATERRAPAQWLSGGGPQPRHTLTAPGAGLSQQTKAISQRLERLLRRPAPLVLRPSWFTCLALKLHFGVSKSEKETSSLRPAAVPCQPRYRDIFYSPEFNGIFSFQDDDHYDKRDVPSLSKRAKTEDGLPPPAPTPPDPYAAMAMYYSKLQSSFRPWSPKGGFPPLAGYPLPHPFSQRVNSLPENALEIRRPEEINHRPPSSLERFRSGSESPQGSSKRKLEKGKIIIVQYSIILNKNFCR